MSGSSGPRARRLEPWWGRAHRRSDRWRAFVHDGRAYGHISGVPLAYVALTDSGRQALDLFVEPRRPVDVLGVEPDPREEYFWTLMRRAGVLVDAETPDAIHDVRVDEAATASLMLYPTDSCNLRCVYCYATSGPGAGPRLGQGHADIAVDDFFARLDDRVRVVALAFHGGGEPTTNFPVMVASWERFQRLANERGLRATVHTITNGTFGPAVLRHLVEPEWSVLVSYDGPRQSAQRPTAADRDSRERVVANLRALRAAGKRISTRATLTRDGLMRMREVIDDAAEVGIHAVQVEPASIVGRGANLLDGPPDPLEFADAFLAELPYALRVGVEFTTSAWSHLRVGDGRYCGAITGTRAVTPDGFVSACTEVSGAAEPGDPFIVGRVDDGRRRLEIWPVREQSLAARIGYDLPHCQHCYMVDTCAGGCASKARAQTGDAMNRDEVNCVMERRINPVLMADLADGRLLPDSGWQPFGTTSAAGSVVALVPGFARGAWNRDPDRRPFIPAGRRDPMFVHLP